MSAHQKKFLSLSPLFSCQLIAFFARCAKHIIIMQAKQKQISATEWIQFHSWSTLKPIFLCYGLSSFVSYFNHDRLIAVVSIFPRPPLPWSWNEFVDPAINRTWIELRCIDWYVHLMYLIVHCYWAVTHESSRAERLSLFCAINRHDQNFKGIETAGCVWLRRGDVINLVNN